MAVWKSAASQPRAWFPPATFQMRLRGLRSIIYIASSTTRKGVYRNGYFHVTLHENSEDDCAPVWKSDILEWSVDRQERLTWSDIDLGVSSGITACSGKMPPVNLGRQSIVVKVWFTSPNEDSLASSASNNVSLEASWNVHFSGLICLGTNPPAHGRLPPDCLVFHISGSYFTSPFESAVSKGNSIPRYMHMCDTSDKRPTENWVQSYNTTLLLTLRRSQRALIKQETSNSRIKSELKHLGILDSSDLNKDDSSNDRRSPQLTLRECVFATKRVKTSGSRIMESKLKFQIESLQVRCNLLAKEKLETTLKLEKIEKDSNDLKEELDKKDMSLMDNVRTLSREKNLFARWCDLNKSDLQGYKRWQSALKEQRLHVIRSFNNVFPIEICNNGATIRSVFLPNLKELTTSGAQKMYMNRYKDFSVALGWLLQFLQFASNALDIPLLYPINLLGSRSSILDHIMVTNETQKMSTEFLLYLKSNFTVYPKGGHFEKLWYGSTEWERFLHGITLVNRNIAELRWLCARQQTDFRFILENIIPFISHQNQALPILNDNEALPDISNLIPPSLFLKKQIEDTCNETEEHIMHGNVKSKSSKGISSTKIVTAKPPDTSTLANNYEELLSPNISTLNLSESDTSHKDLSSIGKT